MNANDAAVIALKVAMLASLAVMVGGFFKYLRDFNVLGLLRSKLHGDAVTYDRIRRQQMKKQILEGRGFSAKKDPSTRKASFMNSLYRRLELTGISDKFPGFSEVYFAVASVVAIAAVFAAMSAAFSLVVGAVAAGVFAFIEWYALGIIVYSRRMGVEDQLLQFTNSCASASRQYASIVDIIGAVYDQFDGPFREALEACYVEAKTTNDDVAAFRHLEDRFDSVQLSMVLDNLVMCSTSTGDYYTVATDLTKIVAVYSSSHDRKAVTLRNAKVNITVMFGISIAILFMLGKFFDSGMDIILQSTMGIIILIILLGILIYGLSLKAEK